MKASEMLLHAAELVGGQRAKDYGNKTVNHIRIAELWNYWLEESRKSDTDKRITAYDAAMMMMLVMLALIITVMTTM